MPSETAKLREQIRAIHEILDNYESDEAIAKIREIIYGDPDAEDREEEDPDAQ